MRIYTYSMKFYRIIFFLACFVMLSVSCEREIPSDGSQTGNGSGDAELSITLTSVPQTKVEGAKDGDVLNTVYLWIADASGDFVYKGYYDGNNVSGEKFSFQMDPDNKTAKATFTNIERGDYTLYIVANLPTSLLGLASSTSADATFQNAVLPPLNANNKPPFTDDDGMPLSIRQDIHIGPGMNSIETQLVRVCGRIRLTVRNMTTDKNIFLQSLVLTDKNPSLGYLFHKEDHGAPAGISFGIFDHYELDGSAATRYIAPGAEDTYIDQYLYETGLTGMGTLGFQIAGGIYDKAVTIAEVEDVYNETVTKGDETTNYEAETKYLIRNALGNYFLKYDGTSLSAEVRANIDLLLTDTDLDYYLWEFSGSSSPVTLKNSASGDYLSSGWTSSTMSDTETYINIGTKSNGLNIYGEYSGYLLHYNSGLAVEFVEVENRNDAKYCWRLIPVMRQIDVEKKLKDAEKTFDSTFSPITYIDKYGLPVTLDHICRNDDVNVVVNIFYSPESGVLYFEVEDWEDEENETTFD